MLLNCTVKRIDSINFIHIFQHWESTTRWIIKLLSWSWFKNINKTFLKTFMKKIPSQTPLSIFHNFCENMRKVAPYWTNFTHNLSRNNGKMEGRAWDWPFTIVGNNVKICQNHIHLNSLRTHKVIDFSKKLPTNSFIILWISIRKVSFQARGWENRNFKYI